MIYDADIAVQMRQIFEEDMRCCRQLTRQAYRNRSLLIKFKESISRLLSELL